MSDLPPERLSSFLPPFYFTGVDYFGSLTIKLNKGTRRTSGTAKRYGVLFTCMTTRAVHLELAGDKSTDSFIWTLRRFNARRGNPKSVFITEVTLLVPIENSKMLYPKLTKRKL